MPTQARRPGPVVALVVAFSSASFSCRSPAGKPTGFTPTSSVAATAPLAERSSSVVPQRYTAHWGTLLTYQRIYLTLEGPEHRGWHFEQLVTRIAFGARNESRPSHASDSEYGPLSETQVLALLGTPERFDRYPEGSDMFYRYRIRPNSIFGTGALKDWVAMLQFDRHGVLTDVSSNDADAFHDVWIPPKPFDPLAPTTAPSGNGFIGVGLKPETWKDDGIEYTGTRYRVTAVLPDSPAAKAGVHVGDLIDEVDGVNYGEDLIDAIRRMTPGRTITLTATRGEASGAHPVTLDVMIGRRE